MTTPVQTSTALSDVRYEIRGKLANRALELERRGYEIVSLNIGNPGAFGFRTPETMRLAMIENLQNSEGYCHQKGIFPAREAVVMQQQDRGIPGVNVEHVFIGNGVSELIDITLRGLLNSGDEVLVPSPDYPLWTAGVTLNQGKPVHYPCPPETGHEPDLEALASLINARTRAIVVINPNNPTGAVYSQATLEAIVRLAEQHDLVLFSDEIYDDMIYDDATFVPLATLVDDGVCGYRVGWAIVSGNIDHAQDYLNALELLASLRLCSNVPAQWAVQTALGGYQSIHELVRPGGRLYETRRAVIENVAASRFLQMVKPNGSMYAFVGVDPGVLPDFDDNLFALDLLEQKHVLVAPGVSFNVNYSNYFRITLLPDVTTITAVFNKIDEVLQAYAEQ